MLRLRVESFGNRSLAKFDALKPEAKPSGRGVRDIGPEAPPTRIPGLAASSSPEVQPGFLSVIDSGPVRITPPPGKSDSTGRRSALARWLTSLAALNPATFQRSTHIRQALLAACLTRLWQS